MTNNKKAASAGTGTASKTTSNSRHCSKSDVLIAALNRPAKAFDHRRSAWQSPSPVLNTPPLAVSAPVSLSGFFASMVSCHVGLWPSGIGLWSGSAQSYNTRKGKAASGLMAVFKYLTAPLNRGRTLNESIRKPIMAAKLARARHAHTRLSVYNFVRRFAGPALAYRVAYSGGTPARKEAAKSPIFAGRVAA